MQVTWGAKNQVPRSWWQEGTWQNQIYKKEYQIRLPFVISLEFKSVLPKQVLCEPSPSKPFTTQYQHHISCGSCVYIKCSDEQYFEPPQVNIGDDATKKSLDKVLAAGTIKWQIKSLWHGWPRSNGGNTTTLWTAWSVLNHSSQQVKNSTTTIIWRVNIEVQLTTHAN